MLNKIVIYILASVLVVGGLYGWHRFVVYESVQSAVAKIEQKHQAEINQAKAQAKTTEAQLTADAMKELRNRDDKIARANAQLADLKRMLRDRPDRPISITPGASLTCTGRELYKQDGEFLAGEAARAEALIAERDFYYNAYENARKQLNGNKGRTESQGSR